MSSMSSPNVFFQQPSYNEKQVALVKKVLEKTRQNKVRWLKAGDGYLGVVPNMKFILKASSGTWQSFAVQVGAKELLKVQNSSVPGIISQLTGLAGDPLLSATAELYNLVARTEVSDVEGAIDALDKL
jgi:hypothetical protein